jgi:hypothetical protein
MTGVMALSRALKALSSIPIIALPHPPRLCWQLSRDKIVEVREDLGHVWEAIVE